MLTLLLVPINGDIFYTDFFSLRSWALSHNRDSLRMCANKVKHWKWISQSSALLILTSWIHKCLWIWRIAAGGWSHLPHFHSLWLRFFFCKWLPVLGAAVPNFLDRRKLLLCLPSPLSSFIFHTVWQTWSGWVMDGAKGWWLFTVFPSCSGRFTCLK